VEIENEEHENELVYEENGLEDNLSEDMQRREDLENVREDVWSRNDLENERKKCGGMVFWRMKTNKKSQKTWIECVNLTPLISMIKLHFSLKV